MKIISKYLLREHAGPLLFSLTALTSLLLLNYIAKQFGNLVGKGLPWSVIAEFFVLSIPFTVAMTLPMAVLVAVLYAYSRLAAENEITAMKASGVGMGRLLRPSLMGGFLMAVVMLGFNDQVLPRANHRLRTLQGDIARKKPTFALRPQVINSLAEGRYFLRANHLDEFSNRMRDITIYDLSDPLRRRTIYADSGSMALVRRDLILTLFDGQMVELSKEDPQQLQRMHYAVDHIRVKDVANDLELTRQDQFKSDREMSVCEMQRAFTAAERDYGIARFELQRAEKLRKSGGDPATIPELEAVASGYASAGGYRIQHSRNLGRYYCEAVQKVARSQFLSDLLTRFAAAAVPAAAHAATLPSALVAAQGQDTVRRADSARADSVRAAAADSARRDSLRLARERADSLQADSARIRAAQRADSIAQAAATGRGAAPPTPSLPPGAVQAPQPPIPVPGAPIIGGQPSPAQILGGRTATPIVPTDSLGRPAVPGSTMPSAGTTGVPSVQVHVIERVRGRMNDAKRTMNGYQVEIEKKFALSVACIVFVLVGAPIAVRFPRGGVGLTIGVSLGVFALYYVGLIAGEELANRGYLTPFWAMWSTNIILTGVGLLLLARMGREGSTARGGDLSEFFDGLKLGTGRFLRRFGLPLERRRTA